MDISIDSLDVPLVRRPMLESTGIADEANKPHPQTNSLRSDIELVQRDTEDVSDDNLDIFFNPQNTNTMPPSETENTSDEDMEQNTLEFFNARHAESQKLNSQGASPVLSNSSSVSEMVKSSYPKLQKLGIMDEEESTHSTSKGELRKCESHKHVVSPFTGSTSDERSISSRSAVSKTTMTPVSVSQTEMYPVHTCSPVIRMRLDPNTQRFEEILAPPSIAVAESADIFYKESSRRNAKRIDSAVETALSPWEKWMMRKTKEQVAKREILKKEKALKKQKEEEMRMAEAKKKERAVQIHKEWLEKKKVEAQKKKEAEHKQMIKQKEVEDQKRQANLAKAAASYSKWLTKTEEEMAWLKLMKEEEEKEKAMRERELKQRSENAYRHWLHTVGCRKIDRSLICPGNSSYAKMYSKR